MCAMLAVVATAVDQWMSHWPDFRLSLLLDVPASRPIAGYIRQLDPSFTFSVPGESYDGVYYWAMAVDPLARGTAHNLIDLSGYRYGHPFLGWMASLLSLGNAQWLPEVFWFLSLATMAAAAWFASRLANQMGGSPWIGLVVAASPGLVFSATSALTEPLQVALVLAALLVWMRHRLSRPVLLAAILVATCLTKEQLVLLPCALALEFGIDWLRHRGRLDWRALPVLAVGPLALLAWRAYLRTVMTVEQMDYPEANNIGAPFSQWRLLLDYATMLRNPDDPGAQIGGTAPTLIVATGVVLVLGAVVGLGRLDALGFLVTFLTGLMTCLGWRTLMFPHESLRTPCVALTLALVSLLVGTGRGSSSDASEHGHGPLIT